MKFEVLNIRKVQGTGSTLAFVDVQIEDIEVRDFRIMTNGKTPYVRSPFTTYRDKAGKLQFRPIVILSGEDEWKIHITILDQYRQMKEGN